MATKIQPEGFRSMFKLIDNNLLHWFPGHMGKGLKQMQQKLRTVDCVVEVHDARIALSGKNTDFKHTVCGVKPHILVLNKVDMIPKRFKEPLLQKLKGEYENVIFTECKNQRCKGVARMFPLAQELINQSDRFNRNNEIDYCVMIIGVPNVGKSSLINALRVKYLGKGNASHVGADPGITRSVLHKIKMCEKPLFYLVDTPGILTPKVASSEVGLKLALCNTIQGHLVGEELIADYLLYWLNLHKHFYYVKYFEMKEPCDNILEVLAHISKITNKKLRVRTTLNEYVEKPHLHSAALTFIRAFREGLLGKYMLDENLL